MQHVEVADRTEDADRDAHADQPLHRHLLRLHAGVVVARERLDEEREGHLRPTPRRVPVHGLGKLLLHFLRTTCEAPRAAARRQHHAAAAAPIGERRHAAWRAPAVHAAAEATYRSANSAASSLRVLRLGQRGFVGGPSNRRRFPPSTVQSLTTSSARVPAERLVAHHRSGAGGRDRGRHLQGATRSFSAPQRQPPPGILLYSTRIPLHPLHGRPTSGGAARPCLTSGVAHA